MALSQMMSKNKVMAEELRLQLAERMPVAIQAMAKAAGVTVNELDALMKQGKVMAADVLPKFADALNELIPNVDTNNLNKSLVDLSNAFTNLVKGFDIKGKFKGIVDAVTGLLSKLGEHTTAVAAVIKGAFWAMVAKLPVNTVKDFADSYDQAVSAAVKAVEGGQRAIKRLETQRALLKEAETAFYNAEEVKKAVTSATTAEEIKRIDAELNAARQNLKKRETEFYKAQEAQKKAATKASAEQVALAAQQGATGWTKAMNVISFTAKKVGLALKAAFSATIWTAALTAISTMVVKFVELLNLANKTNKAVKKLGQIETTDEMREIDYWSEYLHSGNEDVRVGALSKINELLGTELTFEDDINAAIQKRLKLLAAQQRLQQAEEAMSLVKERLSIRNLDGNTKAKLNAQYHEATIEAASARAEIERLKPKTEATPVTSGGGSPVEVEVVNLDADDFGDFEDIEVKPLVDSVAQKQAFDERQAALARGAWVMSRKRDTSNDWKMSPAEIKEEELAFNRQQLDDLIDVFHESGGMFGEELTKAFAENTNLADALRATEIQDALTSLQKEMDDAIMGGVENAVSNIDGIVNAFDRLTDAMDEDATAWERLMAVWELFSSTTQSVIGIIESIAKAKEISAQIEAAAAARNMAANTGEAASEVGKDVAKQSGGWAALVAVPAAISAILAAFAMIPKFAKGGIVGGNSTQGDKVLARLNSGEGVLTPEGLESLHDAANPRNTRKVEVTGVLKGRGRDLMAVIDTETKYKTRTR
jgi:tape measure domain-containing protein